jgi:hypothetical protein
VSDLTIAFVGQCHTVGYAGVHVMSRRVAEAHGALFVDRWDTVSSGFYTDGSPRPTLAGHSACGHLLGAELLQAGFV